MKESLFSILSKYKPQEVNPEENFSTELFVYLLNSSLKKRTPLFTQIMSLFGIQVDESEYENFKIYTQQAFFTEDGRQVFPDITIETENQLIFIEVKLESGLNYYDIENEENIQETINQIQMYQRIKTLRDKSIYLLTKYFCNLSFQDCPDFREKIKWQDMYYLLKRYETGDIVEKYLVDEVRKYMEVKKMPIPKVSYEIMLGLESLRNLIVQMESALEGIPYRKSFGYEWLGYYVFLNDQRMGWVGTHYDGKGLKFLTDNENAKKIIESKYKDEFVWVEEKRLYETSFDFEENHYFCLKAEEQLEILKKWIDSIYKKLVEYSDLK